MKDQRPGEILVSHNQRIIFNVLSQFEGTIAIVWDRALMKLLNVVVTPKELVRFNVSKNLALDRAFTVDTANVLYFVAASLQSTDLLIQHHLSVLPEHDLRLHYVFFVPEPTYVLKERLKLDRRVWDRIESVSSLPIHWFPTEQPSVGTMLQPQLPFQMVVNGDWNILHRCAVALAQLFGGFEKIPKIRCRGKWSAQVVDIMKKLPPGGTSNTTGKSDVGSPSSTPSAPFQVDQLVIVDRWLDPLTPLLQSFSFGGVLDDEFSIDFQGNIQVPVKELEESANKKGKPGETVEDAPTTSANSAAVVGGGNRQIPLATDEVYAVLQDLHLNAVPGRLKDLIRQLHDEEDQIKALSQIAEFKQYVPKLPALRRKHESTALFLDLTGIIQRRQASDTFMEAIQCEQDILFGPPVPEKVLPFIQQSLVDARLPPEAIIRLISLQSLAAGGLKPAVFQHYMQLLVQSYGVFALKWWLRLQIAGLIAVEEGGGGGDSVQRSYPPPNYQQLAKRYRLKSVGEPQPPDSAYCWNGRASLLVRLLESAMQSPNEGNWGDFTTLEPPPVDSPQHQRSSADQKTTALFVVGGLTRTEVSALKQMKGAVSPMDGTEKERISIILSTALTNARDFLTQFRDN